MYLNKVVSIYQKNSICCRLHNISKVCYAKKLPDKSHFH